MDAFRSLRSSTCPPGHFIGEGQKVVRKMLARAKVEKMLLTPEWHERLRAQIPPDAEVSVVPRAELERIIGFRLHQGVLAMARIPPAPDRIAPGLLVALDGIAVTENVGAILRTCAAFGVDGVIVGPGTCSPWHRRAVNVSRAAPLQVPVHFSDDLPGTIRRLGLPAFAAHIHGEKRNIEDADLTPPCVIVLGSEDDGVSPEVIADCREVVYIPMAEGWDCLNVAASAAVLLYEAARKRQAVHRAD